jgi:transcription antitermination factor NusG
MTPQWLALRVRSRCEKVVAMAARSKGFDEFLPLHRRRLRWSDRSNSVEVPLFPGYLFCRLNPAERLSLLTIPGVMHIVGMGRVPEPVDELEILAIRLAVRSDAELEPWPFLDAGLRVRLLSGPLAGIEGILVENADGVGADDRRRVVLRLSVLKRSVAVKIERKWIEPAAHAAASAGSPLNIDRG